MKKLTALLVLGLVFGGQSFAQDFPLTAHVKRIEQDKKIRMDDEIEGHTYGLEVRRRSFHALDWLHVGDYPCRRTKHGFDFHYEEGGKTHDREFGIVSEE